MPLEPEAPLPPAASREPVRNSLALLDGWAQLPEILDGISDGIITLDRQWRVSFVNSATARLLGRSRSQLLGRVLWDDIAELKDTSFGRAFVQAMTEGVAVTLEDSFAPLRTWLEARAFPTPSGLTILIRDVSSRRRADERAVRRAEQLRSLTEAALALTSASDLEERLAVCAQRARSIVGAKSCVVSASVSGNWSEARHASSCEPDSLSDVRGFLAAGGAVCDLVSRYGGPVLLSSDALSTHPAFGEVRQSLQLPLPGWLGAPLIGRHGESLGLIQLWDKDGAQFDEEDEHLLMQLAQMASVTLENARLFEEARAQTRRAEDANRIKDEFLATVSHELRTPLTSILGWTQMLRSRTYEPEKRERGLEIIERNARALRQIVEDLLDVSRIIAGKMRIELADVEPHRVVEAALDSVRPAARAKGVTLRATLEAAAGPVRADAARLQQVVWNLLVNAIKFTPASGTVEVDLSQQGPDVLVQVKDSGEGIDPKFLPHMFQRFRQADGSASRVHGGLGLGLSIVRHLVELHGGEVWADSAGKGKGSTFVVRLPSADLPPVEDPTVKLAAGRLSGAPRATLSGLKVLIVDDSADSREFVASVLEHAGANAVHAGNAAEAMEKLQRERPGLLITDIGMPDEDGYQLLERIRALPPADGGLTPAVALTAYARVEDREHALLAGFQLHLAKPLDPEELVTAVAQASGWKTARS